MPGSGDSSVSDFLEQFWADLTSGWIYSLDSERILVGYGEWSDAAQCPALSASDPGICVLFAPDFYLKGERPWRWTKAWKLIDRAVFSAFVTAKDLDGQTSGVNKDKAIQWLEPDLADFERSWQGIQQGFLERGLLKAVPVVLARAQTSLDRARRQRILKSLVKQPPHLYLYGMWSEHAGIIGATPELLFRQDAENALATVALAGTKGKPAANDASAAETHGRGRELLEDPKERHEHQLVIDDLSECLERAARLMTERAAMQMPELAAQIDVGATELLELPTLFHLQTKLHLRLPAQASTQFSFMDCVKLLHPTPALGVAPRAAGFDEMKHWDTAQATRLRFGAPFGVQASGLSHCVVAIRNIQWRTNDDVFLGSGCGVVPSSVFDREWQELALKREAVKRMLDL